MPGSNDFLQFASGSPGSANTLTPSAYAALTSLIANGFDTGVADSTQANTVLRQATAAMAVLGGIIAESGAHAQDNEDIPTLMTQPLAALAKLLPPNVAGDLKMVATIAGQSGWLVCNGAQYLRTDYPALFSAIGTAFNTGIVDINHFCVPDFRGVFARGWDGGRGVDPSRAFGSYQADAMPAHVHIVDLQPLNSSDAGGYGKVATGNNSPEGTIPPFDTSSSGAGTESRPKNVAINFLIFTG